MQMGGVRSFALKGGVAHNSETHGDIGFKTPTPGGSRSLVRAYEDGRHTLTSEPGFREMARYFKAPGELLSTPTAGAYLYSRLSLYTNRLISLAEMEWVHVHLYPAKGTIACVAFKLLRGE